VLLVIDYDDPNLEVLAILQLVCMIVWLNYYSSQYTEGQNERAGASSQQPDNIIRYSVGIHMVYDGQMPNR
jgi:hypothetical protein